MSTYATYEGSSAREWPVPDARMHPRRDSVRSSGDLEPDAEIGPGRLIGPSPEWRDVLKKATQVASTETTVFVQGESGAGKEVLPRFIHRRPPRRRGPFVATNCAALPESLLESELFDYERGAFTGAQFAKPGQIQLAAGGVPFLAHATTTDLRRMERQAIKRMLGETRGNKAKAARRLGLTRSQLYVRLRTHGLLEPELGEQ